jgi:maleylpyruvate isomerase
VTLRLHEYWRSGTSYRVRIALNLKGLDYQSTGVDLRTGAQRAPEFTSVNPQGLVPAMVTPEGVLTQSPAILEWLEERWPEPPLLPSDSFARAEVRAFAATVGCDIHPLQNLRVLKTLEAEFGADQAARDLWAARWIRAGFEALEPALAQRGGRSPTATP